MESSNSKLQNLSKEYLLLSSRKFTLGLIFKIDLQSKQIKTIAPLKECINLIYLNLKNNQIRDASPIKDLKELRTVELGYNLIASLSYFSNLQKMSYLGLCANAIKSIDELDQLRSLKNLKVLNFQTLRFQDSCDVCQVNEYRPQALAKLP